MDDLTRSAIENGTIHLNPVFVRNYRPVRFKNTTIRVSFDDIFWIVVVLVPTALVFWLFGTLMGMVPGVNQFVGWWVVLISPLVAIVLGRMISVAVKRHNNSGGGLTEFLSVFRDNSGDALIWWMNGQKTTYQKVETTVTGRSAVVDAEVWIGTARSQYAPVSPRFDPVHSEHGVIEAVTADGSRTPAVYFEMAPTTVPTNWPSQVNRRRQRMRQTSAVEFD